MQKTYTLPMYYYKQNRISCKGTSLNANLTHVVRCVAIAHVQYLSRRSCSECYDELAIGRQATNQRI